MTPEELWDTAPGLKLTREQFIAEINGMVAEAREACAKENERWAAKLRADHWDDRPEDKPQADGERHYAAEWLDTAAAAIRAGAESTISPQPGDKYFIPALPLTHNASCSGQAGPHWDVRTGNWVKPLDSETPVYTVRVYYHDRSQGIFYFCAVNVKPPEGPVMADSPGVAAGNP